LLLSKSIEARELIKAAVIKKKSMSNTVPKKKNDKAERTNRRVFIKRSAEVGAVGAEEETTRTSFDAKGP